MFKKSLLVIFFSFSFFLIPQKAFAADVVINEVFPNPSGDSSENSEFIELYNKSSSSIDISGWKLSDKTSSYTLPSSTSISANGYISFTKGTTGIALNNSDDESVTLKDGSDVSQDSLTFSSTIEDKSWSRIPNGTGDFVNNTSSTKDAANSAPPPTSTPNPTNTPEPSKTPTPTKTPTPAPSTTPTKTPTPSPTKVPTTATPRPSEKPTPTGDPNASLRLGSTAGDKGIFGNESPTPTESEGEVLGASNINIPWVFIGLGLIFLSVCGILAYFQFGDKILPKFLKRKSHGEV